VIAREAVERQQVILGVLEQPSDLRRRSAESVCDLVEPLAGLLA
jgi:hypothetical protein